MEISDVFLRNEGYVWREIDGEAILMSPYGDQIHALNDVGTFIWKLMNGYNSIGDITSVMRGIRGNKGTGAKRPAEVFRKAFRY